MYLPSDFRVHFKEVPLSSFLLFEFLATGKLAAHAKKTRFALLAGIHFSTVCF